MYRALALSWLLVAACARAPVPAPPAPSPPPDPAKLLAGCTARQEAWGGLQYDCGEFGATLLEVSGTPAEHMADAMEGARAASPDITLRKEEVRLGFELPGLVARRLVFTRAGETIPAHVALLAAAEVDGATRLVQCGAVEGGELPPECEAVVYGLLARGAPEDPRPGEDGPPMLMGREVRVPEGCTAGRDGEGWSTVVCGDATLMWMETAAVGIDVPGLLREIEAGYRASFELRAEPVAPCRIMGREAACRRFQLQVPSTARADTILVAVATAPDRTALVQCVYPGPVLPEACLQVLGLGP